jgi:hypothetical protein
VKVNTACRKKQIKTNGCLAVIFLSLAALATPATDVQTIIERSVIANQNDWNAAPNYTYFDRVQTGGKGSKTYHDLMIDGSPYEDLVAISGKPLLPDLQKAEQTKLESAIKQRRNESEQERVERIARYEKGRQRDSLMMEQLTEAFDFRLVGTQRLDGFDVYVLKATPRPGYQPPNLETEALTGMQGKVWIDQKTFQWVKVEAEVVHAVSIEGFLARVEPGTRFELEKMPVTDHVWLPKHFSMKSRARILFLFQSRRQEDDTYFGYGKADIIYSSAH